MQGQNTINTINIYNEMIEKAVTNDLSEDEIFLLTNIELILSESILKDFSLDTVRKLGKILLIETEC